MSATQEKINDEGRVFNSKWCSKYFVVPHDRGTICLVCQNTIAVVKEYDVKRRHTTKHSSQFDEIFSQAQVYKIENKKNPFENSKVFLPVTGKIQNWLQNLLLSYMSLWQKKESLSVT